MRTILLAGGPIDREPGSPSSLPRPLWPMIVRPLVLRCIDALVAGGATGLSVCAGGRTDLYADLLTRDALPFDELSFVRDTLPRGPAGCIKDHEAFVAGAAFAVVNAACWIEDRIDTLVQRHRRQCNRLTVFYTPGQRVPCGIYICEPDILEHIPSAGCFDIKAQLIPRLLERGLRVGALPMHGGTTEIINAQSYLELHHRVLRTRLPGELEACPGAYVQVAPEVWVASTARIGRRVRLFGPLVVGPRAKIMQGTVVIGPTSVGPDARVGEDAVITECAIWANACVPRGRCVDRRLIIPETELNASEPQRLVARVRQRVLMPFGSSV